METLTVLLYSGGKDITLDTATSENMNGIFKHDTLSVVGAKS